MKFNSFLLVPFMDDFPSFLVSLPSVLYVVKRQYLWKPKSPPHVLMWVLRIHFFFLPSFYLLFTFFLPSFYFSFFILQRNEMDSMYNAGMGELFDIAETRRTLQARRAELLAECTANAKLQGRFDQIAAQLQTTSSVSSVGNGSGLSGGSSSNNDNSSGRDGVSMAAAGVRRPLGSRFSRSPLNTNNVSGGNAGASQGGAGGLGMAGQANLGGSLEPSPDSDPSAAEVAAEPVTAEQYEAMMKDL